MFWFSGKYAFFKVTVINLKTYGRRLGIKTGIGEIFCSRGCITVMGLPGVVNLPSPSVQNGQP